jgi:hypothetical protein
MATNIGLGYEAQLVNNVLQVRSIGATSWQTIDTEVAAAKYRMDGGGSYVRIHYTGTNWGHPTFNNTNTGNTTSQANFVANRSGSATDWIQDAANASVIAASSAPPAGGSGSSSPILATVGTNLDMTGHKIVDLAPGVAPTDGVNVSQLSQLQVTLNQLIEAGDEALQNAIDAIVIPVGVTMAQVTAEVNRLVGIAVNAEVIDDAQQQAIVDALIAGLQNIDTQVLSRLGTAETDILGLDSRVDVLEAAKAAQDALNAAQLATNNAQTETNSAVQGTLTQQAQAIQGAIVVNTQQGQQITTQAGQIGALEERVSPIVYKIRGGVCTEVVGQGAATSQCVPGLITDRDSSYTVTVPVNRAYREPLVYQVVNNTRKKMMVGAVMDGTGTMHNLCFITSDADIVFS